MTVGPPGSGRATRRACRYHQHLGRLGQGRHDLDWPTGGTERTGGVVMTVTGLSCVVARAPQRRGRVPRAAGPAQLFVLKPGRMDLVVLW